MVDTEIVVVGAGLVGLAAAVAFAKQNRKVLLIDAKNPVIKKQQAWDERVYALTPSTVTWLQALDVWVEVDTNRVNEIHAFHLWNESDQKLILSDNDANLSTLGVIVENQNLVYALWQQISALGVTVITEGKCAFLENTGQHIQLGLVDGTLISAKLIVAADGVDSWVRQQANIAVKNKDFHQTAIVANFIATKNHQNIARQWFAPHEALALLPMPNQTVSMVWSMSTNKANELLSLSGKKLAEKVEFQAKHVLGDLELTGKVLSFSLSQKTAAQLIAERVVLMGDAAHQIHPMAGQGMNLGLRDVRELQQMLTSCHAMQDVGESSFLRKYARARRADIVTMNTLTTGLDALFASDSAMIKKITAWGLRQLNHQATLKKLLIQQAT